MPIMNGSKSDSRRKPGAHATLVSLCILLILMVGSNPVLADKSRKRESQDGTTQLHQQSRSTRDQRHDDRHRVQGRWGDAVPGERSERRRAMREHWDNMSPKERGEFRNKLKEHWETMSQEERDMRRHEMRENWKRMDPTRHEHFDRYESEDDD